MTLYIGAQGGILQIVDVPHATDKDVRSLFALDSLKKQKRTDRRHDIHAPRISCYYGDITGPTELTVITQSEKKIDEYIHAMPGAPGAITSSSPSTFDMLSPSIAVSPSDPSLVIDRSRSIEFSKSNSAKCIAQSKALFLRNGPCILHVSHYSFEWAINVNGSIFTAENSNDIKEFNYYLVGSYQKTQYDSKLVNEFVTMGLTHNIPYRQDQFRFFVDDYTEDLLKIQSQTPWIIQNGISLPYDIWMAVTQFVVDAILPVRVDVSAQSFSRCCCSKGFHDHQKEGHCEVTLDDSGKLHLMLTGLLKDKYRDSLQKGGHLSGWVKSIGRVFAEWGRIVDAIYSPRRFQLKSEYDRWKRESYKKRPKLPSMHSLTERLRQHQLLKHNEPENQVPFLYFVNPNFQIDGFSRSKSYRSGRRQHHSIRNRTAHSATATTRGGKEKTKTSVIQQSIKKLFSFGSATSKNSSRVSSRRNSPSPKRISYGVNGSINHLAQLVQAQQQKPNPNLTANPSLVDRFNARNNSIINNARPTMTISRTRRSIGPAPSRFASEWKPKTLTKASTVPIPSTTSTVTMSGTGCVAEGGPRGRFNQQQFHHNSHDAQTRNSQKSLSDQADDWSPSSDLPEKRTSCPSSSRRVKYNNRLKTRYSHPRKDAQNRFITLKMVKQHSNQSSQSRDSVDSNGNDHEWEYDSVDSNENDTVNSSFSTSNPQSKRILKRRKLCPTMTKPRSRLSISSSCSDTPKSYYVRQEYLVSIRNLKGNSRSTPRVDEEPEKEEQHDFAETNDQLSDLRVMVTAKEVEEALSMGNGNAFRTEEERKEKESKTRSAPRDEYHLNGPIVLDITLSDNDRSEDITMQSRDVAE